MQQKMAPLLNAYGVDNVNPVTGTINIGQGMDRMFDDVKMSIDASGNVSMMYGNGTSVAAAAMSFSSVSVISNSRYGGWSYSSAGN